MREHSSDFLSSEFEIADARPQPKSPANARRNALLVAGASAAAFGLWKRRERGWPAVIGGAVLLAGGVAMSLPREFAYEVSQTIDRSPADVFAYWRDVNHWPAFMKEMKDENFENFPLDDPSTARSERSLRAKAVNIGGSPEKSLQWTSKSHRQLRQDRVELRLAPGERGTEVHWRVRCKRPENVVTQLLRALAGGNPEQTARESLRALKQLLEAGELATTDGQPHGARGLRGRIAARFLRESLDGERGRRPVHVAPPQPVAS